MDTEKEDLPPIEPLCSNLWMFFYEEHGLILLESELREIIDEVKKEIEKN